MNRMITISKFFEGLNYLKCVRAQIMVKEEAFKGLADLKKKSI